MRRLAPYFVALIALGSCMSAADRFDAAASAAGLHRSSVEGAGFRHAIFANDVPGDGTLRIYLEGDGKPYVGRAIATDPTTRHSLALALLAKDHRSALYLGRPCYHGETGTAPCTPALWTTARYGEAVVTSMAAAAMRLIAERRARAVTWVGHSGGGTLAMLLAPRILQTCAVVSIGGNIDVAAWAGQAREDLSDSLDPATAPLLPAHIRQYHYVGGRDEVVPPAITAAALARTAETLTVFEEFDHVCCWATIWSSILARLDADAGGGPPPLQSAASRD